MVMGRIAYELRPKNTVVFIELLKRQLVTSVRDRSFIMQSIMFICISSVCWHIAVNQSFSDAKSAYAAIFIVTIFALILSSTSVLYDDYRSGFLEQMLLTGVVFEVVVLAKWLGHFTSMVIPILIVLPIIGYCLSGEIKVNFLISGFLLIANSTLVILFANSLLLQNKSSILMPTIILPIILPNLILSMSSMSDLNYLQLFFILFIFKLPLFIFGTSYAIRAYLTSF